MATQVQFRGGTTTEHASFNGVAKEVTVDTTKQTLVVQDGSTNGGFPLLRENGTQSLITTGNISIDSDSSKLNLGADDDLHVLHNGTDAHIDNNTGDLYLTTTGSGDDIHIRAVDDVQIKVQSNENAIVCGGNDAVKLYFAAGTHSDPKFETTASGAKVTKHLEIVTDDAGLALTSIAANSNAYIDIDSPTNRRAALRLSAGGTVKWTLGRGDSDELSENTFYLATGASTGGEGSKFTLTNTGNASFVGNVSLGSELTATGGEGVSASLYLIADEGDDNGDGWRINSNQDDNDLTISNNESGSYVDKITINKGGEVGIGFQPTSNGGYCQIQNNKAYTDGANSLATSGSKATFRIKSGNNTSKSLFFGGVDGNAEPYLQVGNLNVDGPDAAYDIHLNKYGGSVKLYSGGATDPKLQTTSTGAQVNGKLLVDGATAYDAFNSSSMYIDGYVCMGRTDTTVADGNQIGGLRFYSNDENINSGDFLQVGGLDLEADGQGFLANDAPTRMVFKTMKDGTTTLTEALRLDSSQNATFAGNVLIGRTSIGNTGNGHSLRAGDSAIFSRDASGETMTVARNADAGHLIRFYQNGTHRAEIEMAANGTINYNTSSDYRLKENEVAISDGITRLKQLKPYRFNFKETPSETVDGFFAHEVSPAVPEAISGTKDETENVLYVEGDEIPEGKSVGDVKETIPKHQGIDQSKLVPLLTAALQEAIAKIETLETKVAALESS